jgi:DNA repair protein RadC
MKLQRGPRERMAEQGPAALGMSELLAIVLARGSRRESVFDISRRLLEGYGNAALSGCRSMDDAVRVHGLAPVHAAQLVAAVELGRRLFEPGSRDFPVLRGPSETADYLAPIGRLLREQFRCLYLSPVNRLIRDELISLGSLDSSLVHPREVFHFAFHYRAASLILAHNHPSGSLQPSAEDLALTRRLHGVARLTGIALLDHLIIGEGGWFSFREAGLLDGGTATEGAAADGAAG